VSTPTEIARLFEELDAAQRDASTLVAGLSEAQGTWRASPESWSVAECLDHLATANTVYLRAMAPPAARARQLARWRRRPALPGILGGFFVRSLEPPVRPRRKLRAPRLIRPRANPPLRDSFAAFIASQDRVRAYLREHADLDLARIRFPNPFIRGLRFSLATGLHVITAHERRHLWQGWNVRRAAETKPPAAPPDGNVR
jgi:hypothetical protein